MEPLLYGHSVGVSAVALLIAVAFWTWIWGGIGLALATPLTVCLVVLGKYVPGLSFLQLLLSDEPVMSPARLYYQRLLAMDKMEAEEIATEFAAKHKLIKVYDDLLLPALISAKKDFKNQNLTSEHLGFIVNTTEEILGRVNSTDPPKDPVEAEPPSAPRPILCIPIDDQVDELVVRMLEKALPNWLKVETLSSQALTGEVIAKAEMERPSVVYLAAIVPGGSAELRLLAKQLAGIVPPINVVMGRYGLRGARKKRELSASTGVQSIASNLFETRNLIMQLSAVQPELSPESSAPVLRPGIPEISHN